ncbi:MAG TPA: ParB/RepB/Spo0J family partition protein [Candidatus Omnitrophota bacterium]|nr:ParB/RepB/Spo0J family partition protein [Candidatus Omnitrophota bacterium]HQJ15406.1 ParB/RepB/Spo0J family partition protein [Candidatus Omnitrophota bacterium]
MEHRALGKGLNALIPDAAQEKGSRVLVLNVTQIKPNPFQPRENFSMEEMEELIGSIREKGVIQPVLVRAKPDGYELIAGERRLRAARMLNMQEIPAIVKDVDDKDSLELALIENIQRQNLNAIEEARAYQYLVDKYQMTQDEISQVMGKARVSVTNVLRLLKLPMEIQDEIKNGRISFGHGRALLEVEDVNRQRFLAQIAISKSLSVRELENLIKNLRPRKSKLTVKMATVDPVVAVLETQLQQALATKVKIVKRKKRGHIVIEFYSQEDLERIAGKLTGEEKL